MKKTLRNILFTGFLTLVLSSCQVITTINGYLDKLIDEYLPVQTESLSLYFVDSPEIEYVKTPEKKLVPLGAAYKLPALEYSSEKYQFLGWKAKVIQNLASLSDLKPVYEDFDLSVDFKDADELLFSSSEYSRTSIVVLIPVWLEIKDAEEGEPAHKTTIIFRSDADGKETYTQTVTQGEKVTLLPCKFEMDNAQFIFWIKGNDSDSTYRDEEEVSFSRKNTDNTVTLTAVWARVSVEKEYNETLELNRNYVDDNKTSMWNFSIDRSIEADFKDIQIDDVLKVYISGTTTADGTPKRINHFDVSITEWSMESQWHNRTSSSNIKLTNQTSDSNEFYSECFIKLDEAPDYFGYVRLTLGNSEDLIPTQAQGYEVAGTPEKMAIENATLRIKLIKNGRFVSDEQLQEF